MVTNLILFLFLIGILAIGKLVKAPLLVVLAGMGLLVFSFVLWNVYWWLSIIIALAGMVITAQGFRARI